MLRQLCKCDVSLAWVFWSFFGSECDLVLWPPWQIFKAVSGHVCKSKLFAHSVFFSCQVCKVDPSPALRHTVSVCVLQKSIWVETQAHILIFSHLCSTHGCNFFLALSVKDSGHVLIAYCNSTVTEGKNKQAHPYCLQAWNNCDICNLHCIWKWIRNAHYFSFPQCLKKSALPSSFPLYL